MKLDKWAQSSALAFVLAASPQLDAQSITPSATTQPRPAPKSPGFVGLIDQNDQVVTPQTFKGKNQVVFMGYAGCGTACPLQLNKMKNAFEHLEKNYGPQIKNTVPVFVSIQPDDTPDRMRRYLSYMPAPKNLVALGNHLLTTFKIAEKAKDAFFVIVPKGKIQDHSGAIYFVDTNQNIKVLNSKTPEDLANSILRELGIQPTAKPEPAQQ